MYPIFAVIYLLPLILLKNEILVQMLSNDMLYDMFECPTKISWVLHENDSHN